MRRVALFALATFVMVAVAFGNQSKPSPGSDASCQAFAQSFFDWYCDQIRDLRTVNMPALIRAKRDLFTTEFYSYLRAEADAQAKSTEVVDIDMDYFLVSQDPCGKYLAQAPVQEGRVYSVEMRGVCVNGEGDQSVFAKILRS